MAERLTYIAKRNGIKKIMEKFEEETGEVMDAYELQDMDNLKEEIVDVMIMCEQIKLYYGFTDESMEDIKEYKINRTLDVLKIK